MIYPVAGKGAIIMKHELEKVELTNMCMILDETTNKMLVQARDKNDWDGISFPGGHIEKGESIIASVIREVKEETGLDIKNVIPCGFKDWYDFEKDKRYLVFLFKTTYYTGKVLPATREGKNVWMTEQQIKASPNMAPDFEEMLDIFLEEKPYKEFFYEDNKSKDESKRWIKKFY